MFKKKEKGQEVAKEPDFVLTNENKSWNEVRITGPNVDYMITIIRNWGAGHVSLSISSGYSYGRADLPIAAAQALADQLFRLCARP